MLVVPGQSPQHFFQSVQKVKEQPFSRLVLCLRPAGQGRPRQRKHRTTKSDSFWEDAGHADVATGRGGFSLRSFIGGRLPLFFLFIPISVESSFQICPLIRMGTEVITLGLQQAGI